MEDEKKKDLSKEPPIKQFLYRLATTTIMAIYNDPILMAMIEKFSEESEKKENL